MSGARRFRLWLTGLLASVVLLGLAPAGASSANISHSYKSSDPIPNGSIVSLDPAKKNYVQPANTDNASRLLGVAVAVDDSLLAVDPTQGDIQVATDGDATVLVSTVNGSIGVGDKIAVSPFSGIGMKAMSGSRVIGLAQGSFTDNSAGATTQEVTDKGGKNSLVHLGYMKLSIAAGTDTSTGGPELNSLQKLSKSLTGHVVTMPRIIAAILIALAALIALVTLIYASIYGSIISVGRNPLAKHAIFRTLGSVLWMILLTAGVATAMIIFLLR